jgi:hypothetical protein
MSDVTLLLALTETDHVGVQDVLTSLELTPGSLGACR